MPGDSGHGLELVAFFFCHFVCTRVMVLALVRGFGLSLEVARRQVLVDGRPPPRVQPGLPVVAPYVDNLNGFTWDDRDAGLLLSSIVAVLQEWGLAHRIECSGRGLWPTLGICLAADSRILYTKPLRAWRTRGAVLALRRQGRCTGSVMQIVAGHLIYCLQPKRYYFSILWNIYKFITEHGSSIGTFDDFDLGELRVAAAVLLDIVVDLNPSTCEEVYVSDSSSRGYALFSGRFEPALVAQAVQVRERWKFRAPGVLFADEPLEPVKLPSQSAHLVMGSGGFDDWAFSQVPEQELRKLERQRTARVLPAAVGALAAAHPEGGGAHLQLALEEGAQASHVVFGSAAVPPLAEPFAEPSNWRRRLVGAWTEPGVIHLPEARIALEGLRTACRDISGRQRDGPACEIVVLSIGDNASEILALDAGRAHDRALNTICRQAAGLQGQHRVRWRRRHIATHRNCSDGDSRLADEGKLRSGQCFRNDTVQRHLDCRRRRKVPRGPLVPLRGSAVLEVFGGQNWFTCACADAGLRVAPPFDNRRGAGFDITNPRVLREILRWIDAGLVWLLWLAIPCTNKSSAKPHPSAEALELDRRVLVAVCRLLAAAKRAGVRVVVENPRRLKPLRGCSPRRGL